MAPVMTRCREVGHIVPTGFWSRDVELERSNARYAFHCAACHKIHQWLPEEIWVDPASGR